jgi:hypothetical protein
MRSEDAAGALLVAMRSTVEVSIGAPGRWPTPFNALRSDAGRDTPVRDLCYQLAL